jgi:hypothetical protein
MRRLMTAFVVAIALVPAAHARSLELAINDDMAQFQFSTNPWGAPDAEIGVGILFNEDDDLLGTLRLMSTNRVSPSLRLGVGVQGYLGDLDPINETMSAIALGGNVAFGLAAQVPVSLVLEGWIAPNILSFSDTERVREFSARVEAAVSNRAAVFIGYRSLKTNLVSHRRYELDDSAHIGVRIGF